MASINRKGGTAGAIMKIMLIGMIVLSTICLSADNAAASRHGTHQSNGLISRLIDSNVFETYHSVAKGSQGLPSLPATQTATVSPIPTPAPVPDIAKTPAPVHSSPPSIETIYGTPTPDPASRHVEQAASKPENTTIIKTTEPSPWSTSPLGMVDLSASMVVKSNASGSDVVSYSDPVNYGIPDMLILLNFFIPVVAIGVILSGRFSRK